MKCFDDNTELILKKNTKNPYGGPECWDYEYVCVCPKCGAVYTIQVKKGRGNK